jgi:hypothetical protein
MLEKVRRCAGETARGWTSPIRNLEGSRTASLQTAHLFRGTQRGA